MSVATLLEIDHVAAATERWCFRRYLFFFALAVAVFIAIDLVDGQLNNGDPDDMLRAIQLRRFLDTGNWYDLTLPMVRMPDVYVSSWSRLVDLPYAAIVLILRGMLGPEQALACAFKLWPAVMAGLFSLLSVAILRLLAPLRGQLPISALLGIVVLMPYAIWEFSPGRIDHHNVQILLLLSIAYGLSRFDEMGGLIVGLSASVSIAIGLETLPAVIVALLAIASAWWLGAVRGARVLQVTGLSCVTSTLLLMVLLISPVDYWAGQNDVFSAPYALALAGFGLLALLLPAFISPDGPPRVRFVAFTSLGLAVLAGIVLQYPALRTGPLSIIDPVAHRYWFDRIQQEMTVLMFFQIRNWAAILVVVAQFAILILSASKAVRDARAGQAAMPALYAFALATLVTACISSRFLRLALAIVPLLLPFAVAEAGRLLGDARTTGARLRKSMPAVGATAAVVALIAVLIPEKQDVYDAFDHLLMRTCKGEDFSTITSLSGGRLMTSPAMGMQIIERAPKGVTVSSIPYHRASPAMSRLIRMFMATNPAERTAFLKDFDYLVVCRVPRGLPGEKSLPLLVALMANENVPGLERVPAPAPTDVMLFRIEKTPVQ